MPKQEKPAHFDGAWQETILESVADGVFTVDGDFRVTYFNRAAEQITGLSRYEALGRHCWEVFKATVCERDCYLRTSLDSGAPGIHKLASLITLNCAALPDTLLENVVDLVIPPLVERREDIPLLVEHFIEHFNKLHGKEISHMAPEAMACLMAHSFPGNVRELQNIIEHAFVLCPGGVLLTEHLPPPLRSGNEVRVTDDLTAGSLAELESRFLWETLARNGFNQTAAAKQLGIHKTTLWRKLKKLGIKVPRSGEQDQ